jgi:hypothetical protein
MSAALHSIHETLDTFSGKKPPFVKPKGECRKDCRLPDWTDGCPYLFVFGEKCRYYGPNYNGEDEEEDES